MKIAVIGYSGSGKSTLAEYLSKKYDIPVLFLDTVQFLSGWQERNLEEGKKIVLGFMQNESWVIDGNYRKYYREERLKQADKIIFMDFNRINCFIRAYRRYRTFKGKSRQSMSDGCCEKFDREFIKWILHDGRTKGIKDKYKDITDTYKDKTIIIKNQRQLVEYMKGLK